MPAQTAFAGCANYGAQGQAYTKADARYTVRCGPQADSPTLGYVRREVPAGTLVRTEAGRTYTTTKPATVRMPVAISPAPYRVATAATPQSGVTNLGRRYSVLPSSQIAARNEITGANLTPPAGYKRVHNDGRYNPNRGLQTLRGINQMDLIWTDTLPRRLIDVTTGNDVTNAGLGLRYPYTDLGLQRRTSGVRFSTKSGPALAPKAAAQVDQRMPETMKTYSTSRAAPAAAPRKAAQSQVRVSTKSSAPARVAQPAARVQAKVATPSRAATQAATNFRYVQVGTYGEQANATRAVGTLRGMGLPVSLSKGRSAQIVLAGPFSSQAQVASALAKARSAGYRDAFARR